MMNGMATVEQALEAVVDPGSFAAGPQPEVAEDPLEWSLGGFYAEKLAEARSRTGSRSAVRWGKAEIGGSPGVVIACDSGFRAASLGLAEAGAVCRAMESAAEEALPVAWLATSSGVRLQEGAASLFCIPRIIAARRRLAAAHLPFITACVGPVFAGAAICALQADIVLATRGTTLGFAGRRVVEMAERLPLPVGFQTADYAQHGGQIDVVLECEELRGALARILALLAPAEASGVIEVPGAAQEEATRRSAWECVSAARGLRPTVREVIGGIADGFFELHGDRVCADDPAMLGGIARIGGMPIMILGHDSSGGQDTVGKIRHNFGMPGASGHRKALRLVRTAERLRLRLLTFIDTPGVSPDVRSESEGQASVLGELIDAVLGLSTPSVGVVLGEGVSGAVALAGTDRLIMTDASYLSAVPPEGAAAILLHDPARAPEAAAALKLAPHDLQDLGLVDAVIPAVDGKPRSTKRLQDTIISSFQDLSAVGSDPARRTRVRI